MPIEFHCASCQNQIRVADAAAGKRGKCPHCGVAVQVPSAASAVAAITTNAQTSPASAAKVSFVCPSCQQAINAPAALMGKKGRCPHCQAILIVGGSPSTTSGLQSSPSAFATAPIAGAVPLNDPLASLGSADDLFASLPAASQLSSASLAPASNPLGYTPSAMSQGGMSSLNPYASPAMGGMGGGFPTQQAASRGAPVKLKIPAIGMIVVASLTILWMVISGINAFTTPLPPALAEGPGGGTPYRLGQMAAFVVVVLINVGVIAGGVQMLRLRGFDTARGGAVAACFPCSLVCLNMIFGIWALVVIFQPDVRRLFH